jgi:tRNA threonylcarbamoyladenosine modification (KEOPS) complex Cgi121 subunit
MTAGILKDWLEEIAMRVFRLGGGKAASALLKELEGAERAVAIRAGAVQSLEELELAYYLAEHAFVTKTNIAKKLKYEFLLWLAGKTDIRSALKAAAPEKSGALVVIFADEPALVRKLEALGAKDAKLKKDAEPLALERISLSRLK